MRLALFALLLFVVPSLARAQAPADAAVTPLVSASGVAPGGSINIALRVTLAEGLHSPSNKPKDEGLIPTTLTFAPVDVLTPTEVVFPAAHDFKLETGDVLLVFEREFVIGARVTVSPTAKPGAITLTAKLRYQPCNNTLCFRPVTIPVMWTIPVVSKGTAITPMLPEVFGKIAFGKGEPPNQPTGAATTQPGGEASTQPTGAATTQPGGEASTQPTGAATTPPGVEASTQPGVAASTQLDSVAVLGTAGGYMNVEAFLTFIKNAETGVTSKGMFADQGPIAILLLVFIGGLALNLTPCVLPMIPINLAIIGAGAAPNGGPNASAHRNRGFWLGSAYGAAMALVYGVLGLVVILTAGTFGTINASP